MRTRLARWIARAALALAAVAALLVAACWAVLSQAQFGAPMAGARLARALANPQYHGGRFVNLEPEDADTTSLAEYLRRQLTGDEVRVPPSPIPVLAVDKTALAATPVAKGLRAFWIGHASSYVEIDGLRLLLDPVFAARVSPLPVGPGRFHPPPIALADLPPIDAVLISHDHYDHLDMDTVRHLAQRGTRVFVPKDIGARLGPFDMAFIKIGAYGPGAAWTDIHRTPEQAVQVRRDVRARRMLPVHRSTFNLAYHDWDEPIRCTRAQATRVGIELVTPRVGEWVDADRPFASTRWWEAVR